MSEPTVTVYKPRAVGPSEIELEWAAAWCVEEREIERLKSRGRGQSKKRRRNIGRAIRDWQKRLARGTRSLSVPVHGRVSLRKYGRAVGLTYELLKPRDAIVVIDEYAEVSEEQIARALGRPSVERSEGR